VILANTRLLNGLGAIACAAMMAYALYAEHQLLLEPCPLCVFQRVAAIALGAVFLVAALHDPRGWGRRVYAMLVLLTAGAGLGVAARHVWLQNLPADEVPACGPGLDYIVDAFPLSDALRMIFTGSGECATVDWRFLGLSMPAWVAICFALLLLLGIAANLTRTRTASR